MDAKVLAERLQAKLQLIKASVAWLDALAASKDPGPERNGLREAEATLAECGDSLSKLGEALNVYAPPEFYENLPPSRATEDGGQHARNVLEYVFSE